MAGHEFGAASQTQSLGSQHQASTSEFPSYPILMGYWRIFNPIEEAQWSQLPTRSDPSKVTNLRWTVRHKHPCANTHPTNTREWKCSLLRTVFEPRERLFSSTCEMTWHKKKMFKSEQYGKFLQQNKNFLNHPLFCHQYQYAFIVYLYTTVSK